MGISSAALSRVADSGSEDGVGKGGSAVVFRGGSCGAPDGVLFNLLAAVVADGADVMFGNVVGVVVL